MSFLERKIPPPLVAILLAGFMWWLSQITLSVEIGQSLQHGLIVLFIGLGIAFDFSALASFRAAKTTINPLQPSHASQLVQTGIYRYSRNPMYVGLGCFLMAWACYLLAPFTLVCLPILVLYINRFQILPEEQALTALFGDQYIAYQQRVRRWI